MQSYVQLKKDGKKEYKPVVDMYVKTSELPQSFQAASAARGKTRTVSEIWQVTKNEHTQQLTKVLIWQKARHIEIVTELGNTLPSDKLEGKPEEKYFIRVDPVPDGDNIKEDKNAQHLPIESEAFTPVHQNSNGEDVIVG